MPMRCLPMRHWVLPLWLSVRNMSGGIGNTIAYCENSDGADGTGHHDKEGAAK